MIEAGQRVDDRYELLRLLGSGGTGAVWMAHDHLLRRDVALKTVGVDVEPERLAREARAAARVTHAAVVAVYDAGTVDDRGYLVMELVDGQDLGAVVRHDGPLEPAVLAVVARDLAAALAAVHDAGLVHRDVTPGNLVATRGGSVKLTDLGTARIVAEEGVDRITRTGVVVGTVDYLAPEQLSPDPVGPAADVYAAGLVLRTLATGQRPFGGGTVTERAARRLTEDPRPPAGVPAWVVELVRSCCLRDVADRPADGAALAALVDRTVPPDEPEARAALAARVTAAAAPADDEPRDATTALPVPTAPDEDDRPGSEASTDDTAELDVDATRTVAVPAGAPTAVEGNGGDRATRPPRRRRLLLVASVLLAAAAVATTWSRGGLTAPTPLPIAGVADLDPQGDDGAENPGQLPALTDDDPLTTWSTSGYDGDAFAGLKDGVGVVLDLGATTTVRQVEVALAVDGVDLEVWTSGAAPVGPPDEDAGASLLGDVQDAGGEVTITGRATARYVTLWFTGLGGPQDDGRFRAGVGDVEVRG